MSDRSSSRLLLKGLEEEVYTGTPDGQLVGLADEIARDLPGFRTEPDRRNPEFATEPIREYDELERDLLAHRLALRSWLHRRGELTVVPGATMSTGDSSVFQITDESNPYYRYIRDTYGTRVVTASAHVSIGIEDQETVVRASRLLRMEACLYLALTASSPFLDGRATGYHSTRWATFPQTPENVPIFESASQYAEFVDGAVSAGRMQNTRHLWISARPNGPRVPFELNRVELRVCDRIDDHRLMIAVAALVETRIQQVLGDPALDPLEASALPGARRLQDLAAIGVENEAAVARDSLDAVVRDWRTGKPVIARDWIAASLEEARVTARSLGIAERLDPIAEVLAGGNTAMRWLGQHARGTTVDQIIAQAIARATARETPPSGLPTPHPLASP